MKLDAKTLLYCAESKAAVDVDRAMEAVTRATISRNTQAIHRASHNLIMATQSLMNAELALKTLMIAENRHRSVK